MMNTLNSLFPTTVNGMTGSAADATDPLGHTHSLPLLTLSRDDFTSASAESDQGLRKMATETLTLVNSTVRAARIQLSTKKFEIQALGVSTAQYCLKRHLLLPQIQALFKIALKNTNFEEMDEPRLQAIFEFISRLITNHLIFFIHSDFTPSFALKVSKTTEKISSIVRNLIAIGIIETKRLAASPITSGEVLYYSSDRLTPALLKHDFKELSSPHSLPSYSQLYAEFARLLSNEDLLAKPPESIDDKMLNDNGLLKIMSETCPLQHLYYLLEETSRQNASSRQEKLINCIIYEILFSLAKIKAQRDSISQHLEISSLASDLKEISPSTTSEE